MKQRILCLIALLFARPTFYNFARKLFHLSLRMMGLLNIESFRISGEADFLRRALAGQKCPVIFDVGANEGNYACAARAQSAEAAIYCFEPHPGTFLRLEETAKKIGLNIHNLGCSSEAGQLPLYDYSDGDGHGGGSTHASLSRGAVARERGGQTSETLVKLVTLDWFCQQNAISRIRLLKIDTEGYELEVLKGARDMLERGDIDLIQFEFNEMNPYTRVFFHDFIKILPNYRLYRLLPSALLPLEPYVPLEHELFAFQNLVAIHRSLQLPA